MKTFAVSFSITSLVFASIGILFKILHWPGATISFSIALLLIIISFILRLFNRKNPEKANFKIVLRISFGTLALITFVFSGLFKIQHWPASEFLLIISTILSVTSIAFGFYNYKSIKQKKP